MSKTELQTCSSQIIKQFNGKYSKKKLDKDALEYEKKVMNHILTKVVEIVENYMESNKKKTLEKEDLVEALEGSPYKDFLDNLKIRNKSKKRFPLTTKRKKNSSSKKKQKKTGKQDMDVVKKKDEIDETSSESCEKTDSIDV